MDQTSRHSDLGPCLPWADQWPGGLNRGVRQLEGGGKLRYGPPWRNNLGFPNAYINITPTRPHSYNEDNFGRLFLRILRLGKRAFGPYGPPIMRVGHVSGYGVKSNVHIGSSKVVRFTWDTALCKRAPLLDPPLTSSWNTRHGFLRETRFPVIFMWKITFSNLTHPGGELWGGSFAHRWALVVCIWCIKMGQIASPLREVLKKVWFLDHFGT